MIVKIHCSWLVLRSSFHPDQGTHQRPFCLANSLGITPKVPFANKMMRAISPSISHKDFRPCKFTSENLTFCLRTGLWAWCPTSLPSRKVSDESLGRDETSFVRLTTNNVFSQVKAAKYEIQKPSTWRVTLFRCKFGSMSPVFHLAWSTCRATKTFVAGWRKLLRKVERGSTLSNKFWLCCSFFIKLTTCRATNMLVY